MYVNNMQIRSFKKFVILCDELVIGKKSSSSNLIFQTKGCQKSSKRGTNEIEQNLYQDIFTLTLRIQIFKGSLFSPQI